MSLKNKIKKYLPSFFFLLKKTNQLLSFFKVYLIKYLVILFLKFDVELNFDFYPLISRTKLVSFVRYGFKNKITWIIKDKIIYNFTLYNIKNIVFKNFYIFKNISNLNDKANKLPISFLESFALKEKEMDFSLINNNLINSNLNSDNYLFYNFNSSKNLIVDEQIDFWHFYLQYIPVFIKLQKNCKFNLLIKKSKENYFFELLNIFLNRKKKTKNTLINFKESHNYCLKNNYVYPYKNNVLLLRQEIKKRLYLSYSDNMNNQRLYISRNKRNSQLKNRNRFVYNEHILLKYLKKNYGFIEYNPDGMSIIDQIKNFNKAKCIIAAHGSALSHLVVVRHNTCVIELNKNQDVRWHHAKTMSDLNFGKNYHLLIGKAYRETFIKYQQKELKVQLDNILKNYI
jgi:hypothetical protein